ncbi:response regulator transcription factor [Nocardioides dongxiaopingii]|uniref:response regulator transcription factor n=1 Tax=Nocardioides TaxID=1839 RepID=UPI0010C76E57|nr:MULTISPECIES: response regulator transcription factor [Nocardioides]QCW50805.1 response regulator transcription factor [Nocardioides sp. S-1144]
MPRSLGLTRIVLVEDHALFAEALDVALTLEGHQVQRVSPTSGPMTTAQLVNAALRSRPRIVLLDLDLGPAGDGVRLITPLVDASVAVVVVTASTDRARWGDCLRQGARTVLPKSTPLNTILATIRRIGEGQRVMPREERDLLVAAFHDENRWLQHTRERLESLTTREREVLARLMAGRTVREIARESFVSEATVRTQVKSILSKLEVSSQIAAVGAAMKARWRPPALRDRL